MERDQRLRNQRFEKDLGEEDFNKAIRIRSVAVGVVYKADKDKCYVKLGYGREGVCEGENVEYQLGWVPEKSYKALRNLIGKYTYFYVEGENNGVYVLNRRIIQEAWLEEIKTWSKGLIIGGIADEKNKGGVFVDIGYGVRGKVNYSDLMITMTHEPEKSLEWMDRIKCVFMGMEDNSIVLSVRETLGTWKEVIVNYEEGYSVIGVINNIKDGIAFITLEPNLTGIADAKDYSRIGDEVVVHIKKIDYEKKTVRLNIERVISRNEYWYKKKDFNQIHTSGVIEEFSYYGDCIIAE